MSRLCLYKNYYKAVYKPQDLDPAVHIPNTFNSPGGIENCMEPFHMLKAGPISYQVATIL